MSIKINFIQRKSIRERVWKTLNIVVGIVTVLNVSMVGMLAVPTAQAQTLPARVVVADSTTAVTSDHGTSGPTRDIPTGSTSPDSVNAVLCQHDISITKTVDPRSISLNADTTFTIIAKNNGSNTGGEKNFTVIDTLPAALTYVTGSASPAPTTIVGHVLTWNFGTVADGVTKTITFKATGTAVGTFTNTATVASDGQGTKTATADVIVAGQCVFDFSKKVDQVSATTGDTLLYTIHYQNSGNANCTGGGVVMSDVIPSHTSFIAGSNTQPSGVDFHLSGSTLSWNAHTVTPGTTGDLTFKVKIDHDASCQTITNKAKAVADQFPDGMWSNKVSTDTNCTGSLKVEKDVVGGDAHASEFGFRIVGSDATFTHPAFGHDSVIFDHLTPGDKVSVEETMGSTSNYSQTDSTCTDVKIEGGKEATCKITNTFTPPKGTITVTKYQDDGKTLLPGATFKLCPHDSNHGCVTITDGVAPDTSADGIVTFTGLDTSFDGTKYHVSESAAPDGWNRSTETHTVTLKCGEREGMTTFTDTRATGTIIVHKQVDTNGDGTFDVISDSAANAIGFRWSLDDGTANLDMGTSASITTIDHHSISENAVTGYHFAGYFIGQGTCAQPLTNPLPITFSVGSERTKNITLCNVRDLGTIELKKTWSGTPGQTTLSIGTTAGASDIASQLTGANGTAPLTTSVKTVVSGTYFVSENSGLTNYTSFLSCTKNGNTLSTGINNSLTVEKGDVIICTFTNTRNQGTIELKKVWAGVGSQTTLNIGTVAGGSQVTTLLTGANGAAPLSSGAKIVDTGTYFVSETGLGTNYTPSLTCTDNGSPITLGANNALVVNTGHAVVCTYTNTGAPSLSITKTNDIVGFTNPGKQVNYTIRVTNVATATATAKNVTITDTLPAGFTFADTGLSIKTIVFGDLAPNTSTPLLTFLVNISPSQTAGTYTNTATAKADTTAIVTATSNVVIRIPAVLGATAEPGLTVTKTVNPTSTNPGKTITYTITVTNTGDIDLTNVVLKDVLPKHFGFVDTKLGTKTLTIGTLKAHHNLVMNFIVKVGAQVTAGKYTNVVVITSDELGPQQATADVTVRVPQVLGATGASARDYLIFACGVGLLSLGLYWVRRIRRTADGTSAA